MNNKIWSFFEIAARTAKSKNDDRSFLLGAVAIRKDGVMVRALNSASQIPNRMAHAEYRIASRIDCGATIYVARVKLLDGSFALSKPCEDCIKMLISKRVKRVYYTINDHEYGVISL